MYVQMFSSCFIRCVVELRTETTEQILSDSYQCGNYFWKVPLMILFKHIYRISTFSIIYGRIREFSIWISEGRLAVRDAV
jgi:hypothetical protein